YSDSLFREIQDFKNSITRKLNNSKSKDLTGIKKPDGPNDKVIFKDTQIPRFEAAVLEELEIRLNIKLPLVYKIENSTQLGFVVESEKVLGLNLYHCNISYLPESISNLTSLQTLNLSRNKLTVVPESITNLTSLKILYLSSNPLTSLPNSIGNLISLEKLYLDNNLLTSLPESFSNLISLQTLILSRNKLTEITEKIGVLKALKLLDLSHNNIQRIENLEHLHNLEYFNIQYNNLSDDEKIIARKSIQEIRDYCDKKKNNPMPKNELRRKKARIYEIEIKKLLYEGLNEVKKEMEIEFLHLGTWRESTNGPHRHLLENQSSWFRENQDKSLILNNKINDANVIKVFMVQLHELPLVFSFGPSETNVGKFVRFLNTIYENTSGSVLQYGSTKMEVKKKINTILNLILHDSSTKKIIVFPESSLPLDYIDEVRIQLQAHLKSHEKDTIIFIGGIEHAPSKQMHQLFNYENRAVIIDNCIGPYFQVKQTPTIISNQDHNLIRECINLQPFPKINLYDTSLGRIAIFFPSDFLRLKEAIPQWSLDYKVDFIVIPSLLGNVMAFYNNVFNIYNHRLPQLKILYANVGEFGGSELFSVYTNSEIKYIFQKKQRDNIGEVIVTRECKLN
ncbi:MAG: leucine-rich repeat domain-containing protein, partial [Promethearchaeota archaeon]